MPVVADIDGVQTELFPIVDEFGVIVFDGDAELYTTTGNFGKSMLDHLSAHWPDGDISSLPFVSFLWLLFCLFQIGRQVRVVCASGCLANADPTNEHAMPAMHAYNAANTAKQC
ncbi:hypothetical protein MRX96_034885 [Rhipicephalus microplus]